MYKKLNRAEDKLETEVKRAEDKLELQLTKKLDKVEYNLEKDIFCDIYTKVVYNLKRNGCLFLNGSDAFGTYYNKEAQIIPAGLPVVYAQTETVLNIDLKPMSGNLYICRDGVYKVEFTGTFDVSGMIALTVNNMTVHASVTQVVANNQVVLQCLVSLKRGAVVKVINADMSGGSILTTSALPYLAPNVVLTLFKIAPLSKKFGGVCKLPPVPKYDCDLDFDCHSYTSASSVSSASSSESDCRKRKHKNKQKKYKCKTPKSTRSSSCSDSSKDKKKCNKDSKDKKCNKDSKDKKCNKDKKCKKECSTNNHHSMKSHSTASSRSTGEYSSAEEFRKPCKPRK